MITNLLVVLALLDLMSLAMIPTALIRRYGQTLTHVVTTNPAPVVSPLALAALVTVSNLGHRLVLRTDLPHQ